MRCKIVKICKGDAFHRNRSVFEGLTGTFATEKIHKDNSRVGTMYFDDMTKCVSNNIYNFYSIKIEAISDE